MKISVITTLYNSAPYINEFYERIIIVLKKIEVDYEIVFVNDGSPDNSLNKALEIQLKDDKVILVDLSRNFGHHQAIMAGLHYCNGKYVFLIDSDLEEEPEILLQYYQEMIDNSKNIDVVYGIQPKRKGDFTEKITGKIFYKLLDLVADFKYPSDTLTARLMTIEYVKSVIKFPEKVLDIWGVFVMAGFNQKAIHVKKKFKGETTYTFKKKWKMAIEIITSISSKPLHMIFYIGLVIFFISLLFVAYIIIKVFREDMSQAIGWASLIASIWLIGGLIILLLGILSIYISKLFTESKQRPLYIIKNVYSK